MKKGALAVILLLFLASSVYAGARNASPASVNRGQTNVTHLSVNGWDTVGNPGYIVLSGVSNISPDTIDTPKYYLWIDNTGDLCMASHVTVDNDTSTDDYNESWLGNTCTKVGGQS
jgi:hypothetical protein